MTPIAKMILIATVTAIAIIVYFITKTTTSSARYIAPISFDAALGSGTRVGSTADAPMPALWDSSLAADNSRAKPAWMNDTGVVNISTADSMREATRHWIRNQSNSTGDVASTGVEQNDIRSLLVRRRDGTVAEIPIMNFFRKLFTDHVYFLAQAKSAAVEEIKRAITTINDNGVYNNVSTNNLVRFDTSMIVRQAQVGTHALAVNFGNANVYLEDGGGQHWRFQRVYNPTLSTDTTV